MKRFAPAALLAATCLVVAAAPSRAQDPVKVAPDMYKVLLDNPHVRILDVHIPGGAKTPMHSHPGYAIYSMSDGRVRFTTPDGKTHEVEIKAGETIWKDAETHAAENLGTTELHVLNIELKTPAKAARPAATKSAKSAK